MIGWSWNSTRATGALVLLLAGIWLSRLELRAGDPASAEATLAWLRRVDDNFKKPRLAHVKSVDDLKKLTEVKLGGHRKSDNKHVFIKAEEFRHLNALPALTRADLVEIDGLTDEALPYIAKINSLTYLNLGDAWITDAGVKHLVNLKNLTELDLGWTKDVTDAALAELAQLTNLESLGLGGTKITDSGLKHLQKLPRLKQLRIGATQITDSGLMELAPIKSLEVVRAAKSRITPKGVAAFKKAHPTCVVELKK